MKKIPLNSQNYQQAFAQTTKLLQNFQLIWRYKPFVEDKLPWQEDDAYRNLYQALLNLPDRQIAQFQQQETLIQFIGQYLPNYEQANRWQLVDSQQPPMAVAKFADVGMPGRKKQQIEHFVGTFAPIYRRFDGIPIDNTYSVNKAVSQRVEHKEGIVDWCCGKGHLAAHLHRQFGCHTIGLEYDQQLVSDGRANADKLDAKLPLSPRLVYHCVDVLKPLDAGLFDEVGWHSGLHACGDLHVSLLKQAVALGHGAVIAPCCYHLIQSAYYQPLSMAAKQVELTLSKDDLRLAVLQTVTSPKRVQRVRQTELLWRTGFDLWYREVSQIDSYTHFPSLPKHWFSGSFIDFCRFMAGQCDMTLPASFDSEYYLTLAAQKMARVKRLEFARLGFRPAMELWLLLDRVLYMQEQGYKVDLVSFCDAKLTPRNGMIIARCQY